MKQKIRLLFEKYLPFVASIFTFSMSIWIDKTFTIDEQSFINCNTAIITAMSIIIGFVGVLIGIISTLRETREFKNFLSYNEGAAANRLKKYFIRTIICGTITLLISPTLFFIKLYDQISCFTYVNLIHIVTPLFLALFSYSIFSTGRIFLFMIEVLFFHSQITDDYELKSDNRSMTQEEKDDFHKKHLE